MRFRLATSGITGADPTGGIGNAFRTMAMMPLYQQQAAQEGQEAQARLGLLGAQQRSADAQASALQFKLQEDQRAAQEYKDRTSIGALLSNAARVNRVPEHEIPDLTQFLQTGQKTGRFMTPADGVGPAQPTPSYYGEPAAALPDLAPYLQAGQRAAAPEDDTAGRIQRMAGFTNQMLTLGDKNIENLGKVEEIYRRLGLGDQILAGEIDPMRVAQARFATTGGPSPFAFNEYGVGNELTGQIDTSGPVAQGFIQRRQSEIGKNDAQAGASRASAASSWESAEKSKQERELGAKGTYDPARGIIVDTRTGTSRQVLGADGKPIGVKDANGKALPGSAAKGYLDNLAALRQVDTALALIDGQNVGNMKGDANATGLKGYVPNAVLSRADPSGVATRALIADIGSLKIHDRSGAAVTAAETPRLLPFIPQVNDPPEVVKTKLQQFKQNYQAMVDETREFYRESGYHVPEIGSSASAGAGGGKLSKLPKVTSDAEYDALPPGAEFLDPQGKKRRKP